MTDVRLAMVGDLFLGGEFLPHAIKSRMLMAEPFQLVLDALGESEVLLVNLEGPLHAGSSRRSGVTSHLASDARVVDIFKDRQVVYNLSNNHIMDFGEEGLRATVDLLRARGCHFFGAGMNDREALRECVICSGDTSIAFVGFASPESHVGAIMATESSPGCISPYQTETVVTKIASLKRAGYIVCACIHWGHEFYSYPDPRQIQYSRMFAEAGADIVIGHHPHVRQGYERLNGSLILYSVGNFFLPPLRSPRGRLQPRKKCSREFLVVKCSAGNRGVSSPEFLGGMLTDTYCLKPYTEDGQSRLRADMERLSEEFKSEDYPSFWNRYQRATARKLNRESVYEAILKGLNMPMSELLRTMSKQDLVRNINRIASIWRQQ